MNLDHLWQTPEAQDAADFLATARALGLRHVLDPSSAELRVCRLDFYPNVEFLRLTDPGWGTPDLELYFFRHQGEVIRLDGTASPIHRINEARALRLTDANILQYLEFFCFFVRGDEGPFLIVHSLQTRHVPPVTDPGLAARMSELIRPPEYDGRDGQANRYCNATLYYSDTLFAASFVVDADGQVRMEQDRKLLSDLPYRVSAPID